jgi:hypothetical protein
MKRILVVVVGLALTGCTTTFDLNGHTQQEFGRDNYACSRDAAMAGAGFDTLRSVPMHVECMESKGYAVRD